MADLRGVDLPIDEHWTDGLSLVFTFVDAAGSAFDLTGYTVAANVYKRSDDVVQAMTVVVGDDANDRVVSLTATQMTALRSNRNMTWALTFTPPAGQPYVVAGGAFRLHAPGKTVPAGSGNAFTVTIGADITLVLTGAVGPQGPAGSGGGAVDSVNGQTGVVVLDAADVSADPAGTAASAVAAHEAAGDPHPGYLTAAEGDAAYEAAGAVSTHAALTATHGVSGAIVGTTDTQTLTNKTLRSFTNTIDADALHVEARNVSGVTITKGSVVYPTGYNVGADIVEVGLADSSAASTMPAIGVAEEDISNNSNGGVVVRGRIEGIDTSAYSVGDVLYVSETAGAMTATAPTGAAVVQVVATVLRSNVSTGVIDVEPALGPTTSGFIATLLDDASAADARTTLGLAIGTDVQAHSAVLDATTASFTTADESKLDGIEASATANPNALDNVVEDTTPQLGGTLDAQGNSVENLGAVEEQVNTVAATGATETLDVSAYGVHDCTMDQACEFTFSNPAPSGDASSFVLILRGAFTPTLPSSIDWSGGAAPAYTSPSVYAFVTVDGGTTWLGSQVGSAFA